MTPMRRPAWMRLHRIPALVLALGAPPCQETNPAFDHDTGSGGASESGATSTASLATTTTTTTTVGDSTGSDPTTGEPPGSTSPPPDPTTTGDPPGDESSSSSGGPATGAYPPCTSDDPPCPPPYDQCYDFLLPDFHVCSQTCVDDQDCPAPDGGTATAVCAGPDDDQCVLDCGGNARCPAGMSCEAVGGGNVRRCVWPT
jgi:hypothetical protein